jgi:hypothetical protein
MKLKNILSEKGKGMWANIHAKRKRGEAPAKPGDPDRPSKKQWDKNTNEEIVREEDLACFTEYLTAMQESTTEGKLEEAEYQGRTVKLNKPMSGDTKKFKVYVKDGDKVKKVSFGQKGVRIKKDNPERRASFRARHKCDQKKDRTTAGYWSCKKW